MKLPVGCSLSCSKMNILCYADDIVLLAPTAQALQVMLDSLSGTIRSLSLKINIKKSCHIVFRHKKRKIDSDVKNDNQILKIVTECKYSATRLYGTVRGRENCTLYPENHT